MADADRITREEAGYILARSPRTVSRLVGSGILPRTHSGYRRYLSREVVEAVALLRWRPRNHQPGGYWITATEAADILGVNRSRIGQLVAAGRLPELRTPRRRRLYRRTQVEVIANARRAKRNRRMFDVAAYDEGFNRYAALCRRRSGGAGR